MTIKEATELWIERDMTQIPRSVVEKLLRLDDGDIFEVTPFRCGDCVYVSSQHEHGELKDKTGDGNWIVILDNGEEIETEPDDIERDDYDFLPMWGTMWAFKIVWDKDWLEDHLQEMADCGFRIYESEDYGYIFGIDGAGYDFYKSHWIPFYKARGLHWHTED